MSEYRFVRTRLLGECWSIGNYWSSRVLWLRIVSELQILWLKKNRSKNMIHLVEEHEASGWKTFRINKYSGWNTFMCSVWHRQIRVWVFAEFQSKRFEFKIKTGIERAWDKMECFEAQLWHFEVFTKERGWQLIVKSIRTIFPILLVASRPFIIFKGELPSGSLLGDHRKIIGTS